jgi:hypothetical protein
MRRDVAERIVSQALSAELDKHRAMYSAHEGYAVIAEELDALWNEVKAQKDNNAAMVKEASQVAAMGMRFLIDLCIDPDIGEPC